MRLSSLARGPHTLGVCGSSRRGAKILGILTGLSDKPRNGEGDKAWRNEERRERDGSKEVRRKLFAEDFCSIQPVRYTIAKEPREGT